MMKIETYTGGMAATNGYLLQQEGNDPLLVDAPEGIDEWLKLRDAKISAVLLTHQHFDHVLGLGAVVEAYSCPVYAFSEASPDLTLGSLIPMMEIPPYSITECLEGKKLLQLPDSSWSFELLHVPGHSPDSLCFYHADEELLFSGDALFRRSIGRTDFPHSDGALLIEGIQQKLFNLPDATQVYPGHMAPTTIGEEKAENPYVRN